MLSTDRHIIFEGGNVFGARAYRKAADIIAGHGSKVTSGKEMGKLQGIGKGTVARVSTHISSHMTISVNQLPMTGCIERRLSADYCK